MLIVDSREPAHIKKAFINLGEKHKDLNVEVKALKTGDFLNKYFILERKELEDFIGSFISGRLDEQVNRMLETPQPLKILLIVGADLDKAYSELHPHSFNGKLAKYTSLGLTVIMLPSKHKWKDFIYRLHRMSYKYFEGG